jgi:hypothetical protein
MRNYKLATCFCLVAGCASSQLRNLTQHLSGQLACPVLTVERAGENLYKAAGCGTELVFKCVELFGWRCSATLSQAELAQAGSRRFTAARGKVVEASARALKSMGYEIVLADPGAGRVTTNRKVIGAQGSSHQATFVYLQYTISVKDTDAQTSVATAVPTVYGGEEDITDRGFDIAQLRRNWNDLFKQIETFL